MRKLFNDTTVVAATTHMPFELKFDQEVAKGVAFICISIIPLCLCLALPVFLYQIVLEKETRLTETMKINGMRMSNYWIVNFLFSLLFYWITVFFFLACGIWIFKLEIIVNTAFSI
jgi:hypothetical protein